MPEKFEALSDEALFALAERMGLDIPPDLERVFVVEEILEALEEDSAERRSLGVAPVRIEESKFASADLVDRYLPGSAQGGIAPSSNETFIRVLVRDPSWAFAFWEISDVERAELFPGDSGASLFLRVTEVVEGDKGDKGEPRRESFDIPVAEEDYQWYLNLPRPKARYRVELCARTESRTRVLAKSRDVAVPRAMLDSLTSSLESSTAFLLRLSGLESLDIEPGPDENPQRILKAGLAGE